MAIARALVNEPALLLADEPTTGLDTERADVLLSLLDDLVHENGCTLVLVSHRPEVLARFSTNNSIWTHPLPGAPDEPTPRALLGIALPDARALRTATLVLALGTALFLPSSHGRRRA